MSVYCDVHQRWSQGGNCDAGNVDTEFTTPDYTECAPKPSPKVNTPSPVKKAAPRKRVAKKAAPPVVVESADKE